MEILIFVIEKINKKIHFEIFQFYNGFLSDNKVNPLNKLFKSSLFETLNSFKCVISDNKAHFWNIDIKYLALGTSQFLMELYLIMKSNYSTF